MVDSHGATNSPLRGSTRTSSAASTQAHRVAPRREPQQSLEGHLEARASSTALVSTTSISCPSTTRTWRRSAGIAPSLLAEVTRQLSPTGLGRRLWGVAPARVGPSVDLVADGSALRVHALQEGALLRTVESLTFQHAADGAATLLAAAAAYERLARAAVPWPLQAVA
jgi:hypothetical protein